jgi:signal transduction histidine kinase
MRLPATVQRKVTLAAGAILIMALLHCALAVLVVVRAREAGPSRGEGDDKTASIPAGYSLDPLGEILTDVVGGGPAWNAGFRPGWRVEPGFGAELDEPGAIEACRGELCRTYTDAQASAALAGRWSFEAASAVLAIIGFVLLRRRPQIAGLMGFAAVALSAPTHALGGAFLFPTLYVGTLIGPPLWLSLIDQRRLWRWLLLAAALLAVAWGIAFLAVPDLYDLLESARVSFITAVVAIGVVVLAGWLSLVDYRAPRDRKRDAFACVGIVGGALAFWWFGVIPEAIAVGGSAIAIAAYFALRHRIRALFLRVASAELRQRSTLDALEAERSRVARDIHDVPLQEISAVIRQLGHRQDAHQEVEQLREVARHLRDVSISLRPPVLDDLGLGAALAELLNRPPVDGAARVQLAIEDKTNLDPSSRPPQDVELSVYRIAQEAINNAQQHAEASVILVSGVIERHEVRVNVADDGRGINDQAAAQREREGRLGMASMRERAEAIRASLIVAAGPDGGTVISITWADS